METKNKIYIRKLSGHIQPFTNKAYSNTSTPRVELLRQLKHYRQGRYCATINSYYNKEFTNSSISIDN